MTAADKTAAKFFPIPANVPARPACGVHRDTRAEFRVEHKDSSGRTVKTTWACKACAASHS